MILVSRNIRYMRIFAGVPKGWGVKYNKCYSYVKTLNQNNCVCVSKFTAASRGSPCNSTALVTV